MFCVDDKYHGGGPNVLGPKSCYLQVITIIIQMGSQNMVSNYFLTTKFDVYHKVHVCIIRNLIQV